MNKPSENAPRGASPYLQIHSALGVAIFLGLLLAVPRFTRTFEEFELELPALSLVVVQTSQLVVHFWYLLIPLAAVAIAADMLILRSLSESPGMRSAWGLTLTILLLAIGGLIVSAVFQPMFEVMEGLS